MIAPRHDHAGHDHHPAVELAVVVLEAAAPVPPTGALSISVLMRGLPCRSACLIETRDCRRQPAESFANAG